MIPTLSVLGEVMWDVGWLMFCDSLSSLWDLRDGGVPDQPPLIFRVTRGDLTGRESQPSARHNNIRLTENIRSQDHRMSTLPPGWRLEARCSRGWGRCGAGLRNAGVGGGGGGGRMDQWPDCLTVQHHNTALELYIPRNAPISPHRPGTSNSSQGAVILS